MSRNLPNTSYEIVVVNDGSTDGMDKLLKEESNKLSHLRILEHTVNMGRGRAVRTAMENTSSDYLIVLDADFSYGPEHITALLQPLLDGTASLTLASPYHEHGSVENVPLFRAKLSLWGNKILSKSFRNELKTTTCIVRGYTRELIDHLELINNGKDFHLEVLYKTEILGFRIAEIPANLKWRDSSRGKKSGGNILTNNPLFKMRAAIISHLMFNFFSKPHILFIAPILALIFSIVYGVGTLSYTFFTLYGANNPTPLRTTLVQGELTLFLTMGSFLLLLAFNFFMFLASQAKKHFEEQYIQAARSNYRLKQIEKTLLEKNKGK